MYENYYSCIITFIGNASVTTYRQPPYMSDNIISYDAHASLHSTLSNQGLQTT